MILVKVLGIKPVLFGLFGKKVEVELLRDATALGVNILGSTRTQHYPKGAKLFIDSSVLGYVPEVGDTIKVTDIN